MRQLVLQFEVVPRFPKRAANDLKFKRFRPFQSGCSTRPEILIDEIQAAERQRLLEPTSLPKVLRGRAPHRQPQTAIIAYAAQAAYERRMAGEEVQHDKAVRKFFAAHEAKLDRLARKLRFRA